MAAFFRIRNWQRFQHYKDRNPPWVKLYTAWPDDYEWSQWSDASKLLAVGCVILAGRAGNRIPLDPAWIQQRLSLKKPPDLAELFAVGFIEEIQELRSPEQTASTMLAPRSQDASGPLALARSRETEAETDRGRGETERASTMLALPDGLDPAVWNRWSEYRTKIREPIKPASIEAAQKALAKFGTDQAAVVEQSIAHGWQGLFALKVNGNGAARVRLPPSKSWQQLCEEDPRKRSDETPEQFLARIDP